MTTFISALENKFNTTETENGAKAYKSTLNRCLDLFGNIAACRNDVNRARNLFALAFSEDPETATRILFWARDIRGGQGEREVFRNLFKYLVEENAEIGAKLVSLIPEYGRWDDLLVLENTSAWDTALDAIEAQLNVDRLMCRTGGNVSLLAKWLPSINASSKESKRLGRKIAAHLGLTERQYRKSLSELRTRIRIVEQAMCSREWSAIDYSKVPSKAAFMYRKAFAKRDGDRYSAYLDSVKKGEAKINAATLFPYEIVHQYLYKRASIDRTIDLQWEALPNYMEGREFNGLVVADVSGSMGMCGGMPMAVSISLAMYIAERNTSEVWRNKFLTFSQKPELQTIVGSTVGERIRNLSRASWSMNTDLAAVFDTVLEAAQEYNVPQNEMPQKLIIVSDMRFDQACRSNKRTNLEQIQKLYRKAGYEMPELIFWNVRSSNNVPVKANDEGVALVSGCSPSILKSVLSGSIVTPVDTMVETVYAERYEPLSAAFRSRESELSTSDEEMIQKIWEAAAGAIIDKSTVVGFEVFREQVKSVIKRP